MLFNANGHHGSMMAASGGDHSFPERHFGSKDYADDIELPGLETNHWAQSTDQVAAPKMDALEPAFSAFIPQSWMDHAPLSFHRSQQNHLSLKLPASNPLPPPAHDIFTSPIQEATSSPVHQTELDMLWGQTLTVRSPSDLVWIAQGSAQAQEQQEQQAHPPSSRGEDDESDPTYSLNDTLDDYFLPHPPATSWHPRQPTGGLERFRRRSVPRVTKPGGSHNHTQGILHGARQSLPVTRTTSGSSATVLPSTKTSLRHPQESQSPTNSAGDEEDDSSKLLSKKIAHKLSEKTRRNRLTMAIREIEKLLPPSTTTTGCADDDGGEGQEKAQQKIQFIPGGNAVSKVEVVEMAIGYIKRLREENKRMSRKIERTERVEKNRNREKEKDKEKEKLDEMEVQEGDAEVDKDPDVNSKDCDDVGEVRLEEGDNARKGEE